MWVSMSARSLVGASLFLATLHKAWTHKFGSWCPNRLHVAKICSLSPSRKWNRNISWYLYII